MQTISFQSVFVTDFFNEFISPFLQASQAANIYSFILLKELKACSTVNNADLWPWDFLHSCHFKTN